MTVESRVTLLYNGYSVHGLTWITVLPHSERFTSQLRREKSNAGHSGHSKGSRY
nr:MAG TPA: hypothetical protein [Caudoviricetes sp.]